MLAAIDSNSMVEGVSLPWEIRSLALSRLRGSICATTELLAGSPSCHAEHADGLGGHESAESREGHCGFPWFSMYNPTTVEEQNKRRQRIACQRYRMGRPVRSGINRSGPSLFR